MSESNRGRPIQAVEIEKSVITSVAPSPRVMAVAAMFGLGIEESHQIKLVPRSRIPLPGGGIVFIMGPSGGGKSTVLNLIAAACRRRRRHVVVVDDLPLPSNRPVLETLCRGEDLQHCTALLALVGLGDAFVMLRTPAQLSDGQRCRLHLAQGIEAAGAHASAVMFADEFGATLDRITAINVARSVRRWVSSTRHTFVCATTHEDLLEALRPEVLVYKGLGDEIEVLSR